METFLASVTDCLWTYLLIAALLLCGFFFTWKTRFVQFRMIPHMFRLLTDSGARTEKGEKHVSSFQAFAVSLASRVGSGNLAGVATAIAIGGPGSVFWMWVTALLGAATAFIESTLAQLFKERSEGAFVGGPAYYIRKGLHSKGLAATFAVLITITFALMNNAVQANTISGALDEAFGVRPWISGALMAALTLLIIFGGIHRIARFSSVIVPLMAIGYMILAIFIVVKNYALIPDVFRIIIEDAFGIRQVAGGGIGGVIMLGVRRGLFSNEAGEGSTPNAAATANVSHPVKQGLIQALGVFTDTLLVCSCTAFIILISGLYTSGANGIALTQVALQAEIGPTGPIFIAIAIFLFAYSTIIANYYYGEANMIYLKSGKKGIALLRVFSGGVFVVFGALAGLNLVWTLIDFFMALLTICNLIGLIGLWKYPVKLLKDYEKQKKQGKDPVFHKSTLPEIADELVWPD